MSDDDQICTMYDWIEGWMNFKHISSDDAAFRIEENLWTALQDYKDDHQEESEDE